MATLLHDSLQPLATQDDTVTTNFCLFLLCYKKHQSSCLCSQESTYLIELGPSSTQGTCNMCSKCAQIFPTALTAFSAQNHAFTEAWFFLLTWSKKSTARCHNCYFSPNMCSLFDVNILPNLANYKPVDCDFLYLQQLNKDYFLPFT